MDIVHFDPDQLRAAAADEPQAVAEARAFVCNPQAAQCATAFARRLSWVLLKQVFTDRRARLATMSGGSAA